MGRPLDVLNHMQLVGMRMTRSIQPSLVVKAGSIDHENVSLPVADWISHPQALLGIYLLGRLSPIRPDLTENIVVFEELQHAPTRLNEFENGRMGINPGKPGKLQS